MVLSTNELTTVGSLAKLDYRMISEQSTSNLPTVLDALADPTRFAIVRLLSQQDRCVCHLVELLALKQSIVSHHLGVLRHAGIVSTHPHASDRRWQYYRLEREVIESAMRELSPLLDRTRWDSTLPLC